MRYAEHAQHGRPPTALVLCLGWLVSLAGIPGNLLAVRLLPALGISPFPAVCVLVGLCAVSLIPLRRVFPLPETPAQAEGIVLETLNAEAAKLEAARIEADAGAKRRAFAAAFTFTEREAEVLDGILRELEREAIGAELGISDRTVKHHINGLLKKTGMANRRRLLHFYADWQAGHGGNS